MSTCAVTVNLSDHGEKTLKQLIKDSYSQQAEPYIFELTEQAIVLDERLNTFPTEPAQAQANTSPTNSDEELVVLETCSIALLQRIATQCQLSILGLNAVNNRLGLNSYRFSVSSEDPALTREKLVALSIETQQEMVMVSGAPALEKPGLLVMDMDSTVISIECIDEIAALAGVGEEVAQVTEQAMQGKLDFAQSLIQRVSKLAGADESILASVAEQLPLMPGLEELIAELKRHDWHLAIASGGFTYFAEKLMYDLGLTAINANLLEIENGKLTGKVVGDIVDAQTKASTLTALAQEFNIEEQQCVAMGDGANDLIMMSAAKLGVAYKAKPVVLAQADSTICHSGLDCMLHWLK